VLGKRPDAIKRQGVFQVSDTSQRADDPNNLQAQIDQLREQVEALMKDRATSASGDGATLCHLPGCGAVKAVRQHAEELSGRIREQPLLALLIAVGAGFVLGRAV
jgi:ElaB/YqjD/DUF883 family membrane-anchored ribosome-binding protein